MKDIKGLFSKILPVYDLMNLIMSFGLHNHLRRLSVKVAGFRRDGLILDVGCGTGDFCIQTQRVLKKVRIFGFDFLEDMLKEAKRKKKDLRCILGDCHFLPFKDEIFDGITLGFVIRHVDIQGFLKEASRVLKKGGCLIILDLGFPHPIIKPIFNLYLFRIIPGIGRIFGKKKEYSYLGESLKLYMPSIDSLKDALYKQRFSSVKIKKFVLDSIVCLLATK
ncbi:TPA: hypothetical protein DCX16_06695 [bacterium]|nr:hypothetical protein [bacterium]